MEWPVASVGAEVALVDEDLWISSQEDPTLYVYNLRMQGRIGPPQSWRAIRVPHQPVYLPMI